jgi:hypothetical protein
MQPTAKHMMAAIHPFQALSNQDERLHNPPATEYA